MFLGVILANKTDIGKKINAMLTVSSTVSVKIRSARSGIPYFKFWRKTNMN